MKTTTIVTLVLASLLVSGCCCCRDKRSKKEKAAAKAANKAREAEKQAKRKAMIARCGNKWYDNSLGLDCQELVRSKLTHPSTANFSVLWDVAKSSDEQRCVQSYGSTVEAKNGLGLEVKMSFRCEYNSLKDTTKLIYLQ